MTYFFPEIQLEILNYTVLIKLILYKPLLWGWNHFFCIHYWETHGYVILYLHQRTPICDLSPEHLSIFQNRIVIALLYSHSVFFPLQKKKKKNYWFDSELWDYSFLKAEKWLCSNFAYEFKLCPFLSYRGFETAANA